MLARPIFNKDTHRFNIAVWTGSSIEKIYLTGREVDKGSSKGKPDFGRIFLTETNNQGKIISDAIVWQPHYDNIFLEDPRAICTNDDTVTIGLTAVLRHKKGFQPFPALITTKSHQLTEHLPPITLIQNFGPGKNLTPIGSSRFFFRPDAAEYYHQLLLFEIDQGLPRHLQDLAFPKNLPWAQWRMGTTMPPIWLNDHEALMIVHGITIENNKYIYSLGKAKLSCTNNQYSLTVCPNPILTPKLARQTVKYKELHPHKRQAIYACGGLIDPNNPDNLNLYVNLGDTTTYIMDFSLKSLKADLF